MQESIKMCVFDRGVFFRVWVVYVLCRCMIFAHGVAVKLAIALLLVSRKKNMRKTKKKVERHVCDCNDVCVVSTKDDACCV